jgi:hypothetical protein
MKEIDLEKHLIKLLDKEGIFHIKGNPHNLKGFPDRLVFADVIYFIELKLGKENGSYYTQTPMQKWWEKRIKDSGGIYIMLTGKQQIDSFVKQIKKAI